MFLSETKDPRKKLAYEVRYSGNDEKVLPQGL